VTHLIERFTEHLKKGKYNTATIAAYRNAIFVFFNIYRDYPQSKFTDELISEYLQELGANKTSKNEVMQAGKALKLFFEVTFGKILNIKATGKVKEDTQIDVLTFDEIQKLFTGVKNIKHKLLLILVYNSGLKINEAINLEITDLDFENNTVTISNKNPKRARILRLAPNVALLMDKYIEKYNPTSILFPGSGGENYYSARNIQLFFQKAMSESGINKPATLNTLRHSFAVHSLEMGMDIHILQKILGHNNIQTTTAYNQFVNVNLEKLRSPLENIDFS
jgi:integrase/recombinase XerD